MPKKLTQEEFINRAKRIHGEKYDYSKVEYINNGTKVIIICLKHGEFLQSPNKHLQKRGCPKCSKYKKLNIGEFINHAKTIHGNQYNYTKVEYINSKTKVIIICSKHGEFLQSPNKHLQKRGCAKCHYDKSRNTLKYFIDKSNKVHNNKYNYILVKYINAEKKVKIICPIKNHGIFLQQPTHHMLGHGCLKCSIVSHTKTQNQFIEEANLVHNNIYNYNLVDYKNTFAYITIICEKHGKFKQTPNNHLRGSGCPQCANSKGYSKVCNQWLCYIMTQDAINLQYIKSPEGEFCIGKYRADGYCPKTNTVYEFHGCFWHGCPKCHKPETLNKKVNKTFGELYYNTQKKAHYIRSKKYNYIEIWECEWKRQLANIFNLDSIISIPKNFF